MIIKATRQDNHFTVLSTQQLSSEHIGLIQAELGYQAARNPYAIFSEYQSKLEWTDKTGISGQGAWVTTWSCGGLC